MEQFLIEMTSNKNIVITENVGDIFSDNLNNIFPTDIVGLVMEYIDNFEDYTEYSLVSYNYYNNSFSETNDIYYVKCLLYLLMNFKSGCEIYYYSYFCEKNNIREDNDWYKDVNNVYESAHLILFNKLYRTEFVDLANKYLQEEFDVGFEKAIDNYEDVGYMPKAIDDDHEFLRDDPKEDYIFNSDFGHILLSEPVHCNFPSLNPCCHKEYAYHYDESQIWECLRSGIKLDNGVECIKNYVYYGRI